MRFTVYLTKQGVEGLAVGGPNGELHGLTVNDAGYPGSLQSLIAKGPDALKAAAAKLAGGPAVDPEAITYLPPLQSPPKIICVGLNYSEHTKESGFEPPSYPTVFGRFASSLVGHRAPIVRPRVSDQLDYEGELVAVIGKSGRNIPAARALDHVIGYSIFNEGSIRDYQFKAPQWTVGKNFDNTGGFGPVFVTADELPPGASGLHIQTRLNGQVVQDANTSEMIFDVANLISILSEAITWNVGDVIVSGTPSGVGLARKPPLFMKGGDVCEVEIEGIGTLVNPIVDEAR